MRVIIAGSRGITSLSVVEDAMAAAFRNRSLDDITEIVSGTARGVDQLGERFAYTLKIPVKRFPAQWDRYGRSAGYKRNQEMAAYADALVAVWDGKSPGTKHMIDIARFRGLKIYTHIVKE
jgi:hypothetical protein